LDFIVPYIRVQWFKIDLNSFIGKPLVSDNISGKSSHFREIDKDKAHKQDMQYKPSSQEASQINKTGEHTKEVQTQEVQTRQMVDDTAENLLICMEHCGTCPSLPFPPEPLLFCARGCSAETVSKKSCNCPECSIYKKHRLQNLYFCETGKATEKKEHKLEKKT
jgi:hypothetical protein